MVRRTVMSSKKHSKTASRHLSAKLTCPNISHKKSAHSIPHISRSATLQQASVSSQEKSTCSVSCSFSSTTSQQVSSVPERKMIVKSLAVPAVKLQSKH